jgi:putative flippase GtrA
MQSGIRFAIASLAALAADFALTLALHSVSPLPLYACAAISFVVVGLAFYFVHEHWTFGHANARNSSTRMAKNLAALACAFAARVGVIALLESVRHPEGLLAALYILTGAGVSFTVNYLANRLWVFTGRTSPRPPQGH